MRRIPLHGTKAAGRVALVDDADYELVSRYRWHIDERKRLKRRRLRGPYAATNIRRPDDRWTKIYMHRLITGLPGMDHADGDGLNNQRGNLRPATATQNNANMRSRLGSTSQFKGVSWAYQGYWRADITINRRGVNLGYFKVEADAARAYDAAALEAWGEYARPNFPAASCGWRREDYRPHEPVPAGQVPGRAYTPEDRVSILARLADVWQANPDLRLGQLLSNALTDDMPSQGQDLFYVEDEDLIGRVEQFYA